VELQESVSIHERVGEVHIFNGNSVGMLGFDTDEIFTQEGTRVTIGIVRTRGCHGKITCRYRTVEDSACAGRDFEPEEGTLVFEDEEKYKSIEINVLSATAHSFEAEERFKVIIDNASEGGRFDPDTDGGETSAICDIVIAAGPNAGLVARMVRSVWNHDKVMKSMSHWHDQFTEAFYCNGSLEDQADAGPIAWVYHSLSVLWKLLFAFIPPASMSGGWPCFVVALVMIGVMTIVVGDIAALLGCVLDISDFITANTLIALGTSMPDTLASKIAAEHDDCADNAVGNVTGSNSVNVFLGLGIPWTIASIYWSSVGQTSAWKSRLYNGQTYLAQWGSNPVCSDGCFVVPKGNLGFSVSVFSACMLLCIALLVIRRVKYGGELGGPKAAQIRDSAFLALLWVVFLVASIVNSLQPNS